MDRSVSTQLKSAARTALTLFLWIMAALFVLYLFSGVYSIDTGEVGVHQRFGKVIDPMVGPGIGLAYPWPIDRINKVPFPKVERIHIQDFSENFSLGDQGFSFTSLTGLGTYAITGDNNLVNLECILQYEVSNPVSYLFNLGESIETADSTVKRFLIEMAGNTLLHCLARMGVDEALTIKRGQIVTYVKKNLQRHLDEIDSGLVVTFVEIKEVTPPRRVKEYFDDVISAKNDKEKAVYDAESYRYDEIPDAEGRAARLRAEAEAYYSEVIRNAEGEADRFLKQFSEYRKDPGLTRYRLYMDSVREILSLVEKYYIVDTSSGRKPAAIKLFK